MVCDCRQERVKNELLNMYLTGRLKQLGFRTDIVDLLHASVSLQEGLPVALMEALIASVHRVASRIKEEVVLLRTLH